MDQPPNPPVLAEIGHSLVQNRPVREIERLIQKLEIDKDILTDQNAGPDDQDIADAHQRDRNGQTK